MSVKSTLSIAVAAVALCIAIPQLAHADPWHGNNNWNHNDNWRRDNDDYRGGWNRGVEHVRPRVERVIVEQPRVIYRNVYTPVYHPVIYRPVPVRYVIGQRYVYYRPVPQPILVKLRPAPYGYYYTMCDDNVFLVSQRDNVITEIFAAFNLM